MALILAELEAADLSSLALACKPYAEAGQRVRACFDETMWRSLCIARGWSWDSLGELSIHVHAVPNSVRVLPVSPPGWLRRQSIWATRRSEI